MILDRSSWFDFADKDLKWSRTAERYIKCALVDSKINVDNDADSFDEACDDESSDELLSDSTENEGSQQTGSKGKTLGYVHTPICYREIHKGTV